MIINYAIIFSILLIVFYLITTIFSYFKSKKSGKIFNFPRKIVEFFFLLYFIAIIYFTMGNTYGYSVLTPIHFGENFYINLIPLKETILMFQQDLGTALYNVFGNTIMFIPLGVFIPLLYRKKLNILHITLYGSFCSLLIELSQIFTGLRSFDIDDIIINTIGSIIGFLIYRTIISFNSNSKLKDLLFNISSNKSILREIVLITVPMLLLINTSIYFSRYSFFKSRAVDKNNIVQVFKEKGNSIVKSNQIGDTHYYLSKNNDNNFILSQYEYQLDYFIENYENLILDDNLTLNDNKGNKLILESIEFASNKVKTMLIYGELLSDKILKIKHNGKEQSVALKAGYYLDTIDVSALHIDDEFESYFE